MGSEMCIRDSGNAQPGPRLQYLNSANARRLHGSLRPSIGFDRSRRPAVWPERDSARPTGMNLGAGRGPRAPPAPAARRIERRPVPATLANPPHRYTRPNRCRRCCDLPPAADRATRTRDALGWQRPPRSGFVAVTRALTAEFFAQIQQQLVARLETPIGRQLDVTARGLRPIIQPHPDSCRAGLLGTKRLK